MKHNRGAGFSKIAQGLSKFLDAYLDSRSQKYGTFSTINKARISQFSIAVRMCEPLATGSTTLRTLGGRRCLAAFEPPGLFAVLAPVIKIVPVL